MEGKPCTPVVPGRSLVSWLPYLWSEVLFPAAHRTVVEPWRWPALLLLVVLPALLLYPTLGFHLFEPDEARYAQIPAEMLRRGDLVVPTLQGEPYLDKPPLLYWCIMGSYSLLGVDDASARLVPALALHAAILVLYLLGRRSMGERPAFWGALLLAVAPGFMAMGRLLILDGLLTFCTTLALLAGFEAVRRGRLRWGWWLLAALACGLGILTKGPVTLVLLAPPLWLHARLTRSGARPGWRGLAAFALVVLLINLPWYVAISLKLPGFLRYFFWEHHVLRYATTFAHEEGVWFYLPIVLVGLLPGALLAWPFLRFLLAGDEDAARRRTPELGFVLLAGGWCVLFFTLSTCKLPTYVMPAFPPLALALGYFLCHSRWRDSRWPLAGTASAFLLLCLAHHVAIPWYAWYRSPMGRPELVTPYLADRDTPVVCYPRECSSVPFYLARADMPNLRSKEIETLRALVRSRPRTVILCTHRHSLEGLRQLLPPEVHIVASSHLGLADIPWVPREHMKALAKLLGQTALGLCDVAIVERRQ